MDNEIPEINELIQQFSKLPGLGPKSAKRIILKLINNKDNMVKPLAKSLAEVYKKKVEEHGVKVTTIVSYEDGKKDYSSEVATLASAGGDAVAIIGYLEQGGKEIIKASLDSGAFDKFILSERMIGQSLIETFGICHD